MNAADGVVLSVSGLRKSYGNNEVLQGLDFAIRRGECFGLLGPNGAGKTTTLRCCLGLSDPNAGTITLVGEPVPKAAREARIRVGVVPQMDTTHFMDEAERLRTRLAVMDHGRMIASDAPRALIAAHVEPEVIEVYGDAARTWADAHGRRLADRLEVAGETAFCYARDAAPLLSALAHAEGVRYLHRPANLEDLFIKLTGRELRD